MMKRILGIAAVALLTMIGSALAQDTKTAAPETFRQVLDNDRVRVFKVNFKPGAKVDVHNRPGFLLWVEKEGSLVFALPGKTPYEVTFLPGEVQSFPAMTVAFENDTDQEFRAIMVELKGAPTARVAHVAKSKVKARSRGKGKAHVRKRRR
jgi:quercetin dioxygenase-like cupin family protein